VHHQRGNARGTETSSVINPVRLRYAKRIAKRVGTSGGKYCGSWGGRGVLCGSTSACAFRSYRQRHQLVASLLIPSHLSSELLKYPLPLLQLLDLSRCVPLLDLLVQVQVPQLVLLHIVEKTVNHCGRARSWEGARSKATSRRLLVIILYAVLPSLRSSRRYAPKLLRSFCPLT